MSDFFTWFDRMIKYLTLLICLVAVKTLAGDQSLLATAEAERDASFVSALGASEERSSERHKQTQIAVRELVETIKMQQEEARLLRLAVGELKGRVRELSERMSAVPAANQDESGSGSTQESR